MFKKSSVGPINFLIVTRTKTTNIKKNDISEQQIAL